MDCGTKEKINGLDSKIKISNDQVYVYKVSIGNQHRRKELIGPTAPTTNLNEDFILKMVVQIEEFIKIESNHIG